MTVLHRCHPFLLFFTPLILLLIPPSSPASLEEKEILLQFKSNISDPNGSLSSWSATGDPCHDFAGIRCGPSGAVERIVLHESSLSGTLPAAISLLPSLQILSLFGNRFTGVLPPEYAGILTIRKLNLSRNDLSGEIPASLGALPGLRLLDLSGNSFSGELPAALFFPCFRIRFVSVSHNRLTGPIPAAFAACSRLVGVDFSFNDLTGGFPPQLCTPPGMAYVSLKRNSLSGTVADKLAACRSLELLDLGSNSFSGLAPFDLLVFENLTYLNASSNSFQGQIPVITACSARLQYLDLSGNNLAGEITPSISNCKALRLLDLGSNRIGGTIPSEIGALKSLSVLRLGNNTIGGAIPQEFGSIDLLQVLDIPNLRLSGEIPASLSQCRFLLELDASGNGLQGQIPETFYNMTYLKHLDLHRNRLTGTIPAILGEFSGVEFLDLSENSLTGEIPPSLGNLSLLTHFNVSYNNLVGPIPSSPMIQKFGPSAFSHNPLLCGIPINTPCPANAGGGSRRRNRVLTVSAIVAILAAAVILSGVCLISIVNIVAKRRKIEGDEEILVSLSESTPQGSTGSNVIVGKLVLFSKSLPSKYKDWEAGTKALLDKDCLIGGGSIGTVYRASFEGDISIAVKKLETLGRIRTQDEFEQEMGRLGSIKHPNLVAVQGYYWSTTLQLILSEFVPNGNLYEYLHGDQYSSSSSGSGEIFWSRRFKIALGTARALAYLHHDCKPQVLHLNIKSTNILLGEGYEAKLSDFGMGKILPILGSYNLTKFHTAIGYVAPELASQSLRYSDKCDVYSFGVVLLEIVTARKPVDSPGAAEVVVVLRDYVRRVLEDGIVSDCFDRRLRGSADTELIQVLKLGLICTCDAPSRRPSMAEVVQFLESIISSS